MYNTAQLTALCQLCRDLGHLGAAVAVLAYLANKITATPTGLILFVAFIFIGFSFRCAEDKVTQLVEDLREFRKLHLGAIALAWATNGVEMDLGFWIMVFFVAAAFVCEWTLLKEY
tara:strand:+ start:203 stop:550 length:348 start_codon:yes stop_codon:yes gene_type:complete